MKRIKVAVAATVLVAGLASAAGAWAWANEVRAYSYEAVLGDPDFVARAPAGVKLYFGDQPAAVKSQIGPTKSSRKRPTPARKTPISTACRTVARDALVAMALDAQKRGGNAVIGIASDVDGKLNTSVDRYDCAIGTQMLGVALVGTVAVVE